MEYVIIDESGRFGDSKSRIIVFAAVCTDSLVGLDKIIPKVKKKLPKKGKRKRERRLPEIKFSRTGDKTRRSVLQEIVKKDIDLFLLIIDTQGRRVADNPENYALIVSKLLLAIKRKNPKLKHVVIDRHFTWVYQIERFNQLVEGKVKRELFIEHLDSQQNTIVPLADFVAGAARERYAKDDKEWKEIVKEKIVYEKRIFWKDLKQQKKVKA